MLKQKRQLFEFLFVTSDLFVVSCAWVLSYWLRFQTDFIPADKGIPPIRHYLSMLLFIWLIWAFVFKRFGLYRPMRWVRRTRELWLLIQANALSLVLFISVTYLFREKDVPFSRLVFAYFALLAVVFTALQRSLLRFVLHEIRRKGYNLRYVLIVGAGKLAGDIAARIRAHPELGIQLLGCLSREGESSRGPARLSVIGKYTDLKDLINKMEVDQVLVALPLEDNQYLPDMMAVLKDSVVDVKIVPDLAQFVSVGGAVEEFEGLPVISVQSSPLEGIGLVMKRAFDLVLALILLVVALPLMVLIAILVKLTSPGPVLYRQERVSFDGSRFTIFKFRTMTQNAEQHGPQWSKRGDQRITPLGRLLREYSLDELPQLFNVLRGDMSIVGPRPERPVFIEEFRRRVPRYMLRHKVPAGMTGWAQVNGWRGDTSIDKRIEYDLYYIENWSLLLDFKILALTLLRGFRNRNAC